jgi:esterase/lipase
MGIFSETSPSEAEFKGNPQFTDKKTEAPELAKVQLQQEIQTVEESLMKARARVEQAKQDEMIDMDAAENLVSQLEQESAELHQKWTDQFGDSETVH